MPLVNSPLIIHEYLRHLVTLSKCGPCSQVSKNKPWALTRHMSGLGFHFLAAVTLRCYASGSLLFFYREAGVAGMGLQPSSDGRMTAGFTGSAKKGQHRATLSPYRRDRLLLQNFDLATCTNIQSVLTSYHQTKPVPINQMAAQVYDHNVSYAPGQNRCLPVRMEGCILRNSLTYCAEILGVKISPPSCSNV